MFNIEKYLQKFSKGLKSQEDKKELVVKVIREISKLNIEKDKIEIKNEIVFVETSRVGKNQLFLFKRKILDKIKNEFNITLLDIK